MKVKAFFIIAIILSFMSCKLNRKPGWTRDDEKRAYDQIYEGAHSFKNDNQRKQFALFMIKQLKSKLPKGIESISADSLGFLYHEIALSYTRVYNPDNLQMTISWTNTGEQTLKKTLLSSDFAKNIDKGVRNEFCTCFVLKLRKNSPDSMRVPIPDSISIRIIRECKTEMGNKATH